MDLTGSVTEFIFIENKPQKSDAIFIVGSNYPEPAENAAKLMQDGYAKLVVPSGKYSKKLGCFPGSATKAELYDGEYKTEHAFMEDVLMKNGVKKNQIIKEDRSSYTYENALEARKATAFMDIKTAIICCQSFHARRSLAYYQLAFPGTKFVVCPSDTQGITRHNWHRSEHGISLVMGEVQRCGEQFKDILKNNLKTEEL